MSEFEIMGLALSTVLSIIAFAFAKRCRACGNLKFGLYHVRGFDLKLAKAYRVCPKCGDRLEAGIIADDGIVFWKTGETGEINNKTSNTTRRCILCWRNSYTISLNPSCISEDTNEYASTSLTTTEFCKFVSYYES